MPVDSVTVEQPESRAFPDDRNTTGKRQRTSTVTAVYEGYGAQPPANPPSGGVQVVALHSEGGNFKGSMTGAPKAVGLGRARRGGGGELQHEAVAP